MPVMCPDKPTTASLGRPRIGGSTAVVVATRFGSDPPPESGALWRRVGGQTLLTRNAVLLARAGITRLIVISLACETERLKELARDPRLRGLEISAVGVTEDQFPVAQIIAALEPDPAAEVWLIPADLVTSANLLERLLATTPRPVPGGVVCASSTAHATQDDRFIWRCSSGFLNALRNWLGAESNRLPVDFFNTPGGQSVSRFADIPSGWMRRVDGPESAKQAERRLFDDCRKAVDGPADRYVNRFISLAISRSIRDWPVSPNAISGFTLLVGLAAGWAATQSTYSGFLAAALLMQCNSILDCVDGELARVRLQQSRWGQWLDTISDDLSNVFFFGGLAWGAAQLPGGAWLAAAGLVACLGQILMSAICYPELIATGSGDLLSLTWEFDARPNQSPLHRLLATLRWVVKKDFFILGFVVLAIFGLLPWALYPAAVGAVGSVGAAVWRAAQALRRKPATDGELSPT